MTVATYTQPDYTTDTGSAYMANIDAATAVNNETGGAYAPHEAATPNMTVVVDAGRLQTGITLVENAQQTTGTITAPATNPRNDIVVIDSTTGVVSVITGAEAASPVDPAITSGKIPVARISLQTSTTSITNSILDDLRPLMQPVTLSSIGAQAEDAKGADIASAAALTLGTDGNYFDVTGTTTITSINTVGVGTQVKLHFDAALTLTHHATDLILPGGADITTAAGDEAEFIEYATGDWRCVNYQRASDPHVYEEGTFTPVLWDNSLFDEGATYSEQTGNYTIVGNRLFFSARIRLTGTGTLVTSQQARIGGLPRDAASQGNVVSVADEAGSAFSIAASNTVCGIININSAYIKLRNWDTTSGTSILLISELTTSGNIISMTGSYQV